MFLSAHLLDERVQHAWLFVFDIGARREPILPFKPDVYDDEIGEKVGEIGSLLFRNSSIFCPALRVCVFFGTSVRYSTGTHMVAAEIKSILFQGLNARV